MNPAAAASIAPCRLSQSHGWTTAVGNRRHPAARATDGVGRMSTTDTWASASAPGNFLAGCDNLGAAGIISLPSWFVQAQSSMTRLVSACISRTTTLAVRVSPGLTRRKCRSWARYTVPAPGNIVAQHRGKQRPAQHSMGDDAVKPGPFGVNRIEMSRINVPRDIGEEFDVILGDVRTICANRRPPTPRRCGSR